MKLRVFCAALLGLAIMAAANPQVSAPVSTPVTGSQHRSYYFAAAMKEMPYRLYVPTTWDGKSKLPLILFLHGGGSDENRYLDANDRQLEKLAEKHGYILVAPLGYTPIGSYGTPMTLRGSFGNLEGQAEDRRRADAARVKEIELSEQDTLAVLDRTIAEFNVDSKQVYLAGHSMGAGGGWFLANKYPGRFAALGLMSGPLIEESLKPFTNLGGVPIDYSEGTQAPSYASSRKLYEAAKALGLNIRYREFDATHGGMVPLAAPGVFAFFDKVRQRH